MERVASYILEEQELTQKMEFLYYLKKRVDIFFDNSVIFKTELAKLFIEKGEIEDVDKNLALTGCLLYGCKKSDMPQSLEEVKQYPQKSADFLRELGFPEDFCQMCMEHNRYNENGKRTKEGDILELVEQFGGMLLHRPERRGFPVDEALILLEHRNLKGKRNRYLEKFKDFIVSMEEVRI